MNSRFHRWLFRSCLLALAAGAGLETTPAAAQSPLRYGGVVGQDFGYSIQITVDARTGS